MGRRRESGDRGTANGYGTRRGRFNTKEFVIAYMTAYKSGKTVVSLAQELGITTGAVRARRMALKRIKVQLPSFPSGMRRLSEDDAEAQELRNLIRELARQSRPAHSTKQRNDR
jgi:hypothetical protein